MFFLHNVSRAKVLFVSWMAAILVFSLAPAGGGNTALSMISILGVRADYLVHMFFFVPLFPLWMGIWPRHNRWLVLLLCLFVAFSAEGVHSLLPYRGFNIKDLVANSGGVLAGALATMTYHFAERWN